MYKVLIADDNEEIVNSIKNVLEQHVEAAFQIMTARTGRKAIEVSDEFRPDIVFIELELSGIRGIETMREIRNNCPNVTFIITSACEKFTYAREAIGIGILDYISKPFDNNTLLNVLKNAILKVDEEKKKRSLDLEMKEKLEIVTPIIENGFINAILYQKSDKEEIDHFCTLLDIEEKEGCFMSLQFGELSDKDRMENVVGTSVRLQKEYPKIKDIIKQYFRCCVGAMMGNKISIFVYGDLFNNSSEYELRIDLIEKSRKMVRELRNHFEAKFKVGIGAVHSIYNFTESYNEATRSLEYNTSDSVVHFNDLPLLNECEEKYLIDIEKQLLKSIEFGNISDSIYHAKCFFECMVNYGEKNFMDVKLKVLELIFRAEIICFENGGMPYCIKGRGKYLDILLEIQNYYQLQRWFEEKIVYVCRNICSKKDEEMMDVVKKAMEYIKMHYAKEIDLEEVSKYLQISPYYFSKLFKKRTGKNFIEYLTEIRIEHAKTLLSNSAMSMKEICLEVGYSDANYFSRAFKKNVGLSPTEYKEEIYGA